MRKYHKGAFDMKRSKRSKALERLKILEQWEELTTQGVVGSSLCRIFAISLATYYLWKQAYDIYGLAPKSTRPHRVRAKEGLTKAIITKIKDLRNQNLMYGKVKIHSLLVKEGYALSLSSVGRALKFLMSRNLVVAVVVLKCQKERKIIRQFNKHSKRLPKGYKTQIEIDHTIINLQGIEHKQFAAYDMQSKYCVSEVYEQATSENAALFLDKVIREFPIPVKEIQVDGGSEFRLHLEQACKDKQINLFVLPPRSPELNGGVERLNQT
jgi:transposase